jgi:hypothetical protein
MALFLYNYLSVMAHMLNEVQCSTHDVDHTVETYPNYYDPIYYPDLHAHIYVSASLFCSWLQSVLSSHLMSCVQCMRFICSRRMSKPSAEYGVLM